MACQFAACRKQLREDVLRQLYEKRGHFHHQQAILLWEDAAIGWNVILGTFPRICYV